MNSRTLSSGLLGRSPGFRFRFSTFFRFSLHFRPLTLLLLLPFAPLHLFAPLQSFLTASFTSHCPVPVILDCVVWSTWKKTGNHRPPIAKFSVFLTKNALLFFCPWRFVHAWGQMVEPALSTLFTRTPLEKGGQATPALFAELLDKIDDSRVLFGRPGPF
jgi:hypothetical protein